MGVGFDDEFQKISYKHATRANEDNKRQHAGERILRELAPSAVHDLNKDITSAIRAIKSANVPSLPVITANFPGNGRSPAQKDFIGSQCIGHAWKLGIGNGYLSDVNGGVVYAGTADIIDNNHESMLFRKNRTTEKFRSDKWRARLFNNAGISQYNKALVIPKGSAHERLELQDFIPVLNGDWEVRDGIPRAKIPLAHGIQDRTRISQVVGIDGASELWWVTARLDTGQDAVQLIYLSPYYKQLAELVHKVINQDDYFRAADAN